MRPAVYASVIRSRKHSGRRVAGLKHEFSRRQMILMLFSGSLLIIFGLIVTIIGLVKGGNITDVHGDRVLYKVIGPAGLACGIGLVAAGGIYYCCWGYIPGGRLRHTSTCSVPTVSQPTNPSAYNIIKSESSPQHFGSNSLCQRSDCPPAYQVTSTTSPPRPRLTSRSSQNSSDAGSSHLPDHHRCSSCSSSQQMSHKNKRESKSDASIPDDAQAGSFDIKLEMTKGV